MIVQGAFPFLAWQWDTNGEKDYVTVLAFDDGLLLGRRSATGELRTYLPGDLNVEDYRVPYNWPTGQEGS